MGICRWIRSHFTDWFDRNGVTLSTKSQEWGCTLSGSGGSSKAGSCTQFRTDGLIISLDRDTGCKCGRALFGCEEFWSWSFLCETRSWDRVNSEREKLFPRG